MGFATPEVSPVFDVVIPVFKTLPEHLQAAVDSVLQQTFGEWKIYISDGTPEDHEWHSRKALAEYDDPRIHILQQEGLGISDARNQATLAGSNPYVALLDSDDWWDRNKLERYVEVLEDNPELKFIWSGARVPIELTSLKGNLFKTERLGGLQDAWSHTNPKHRWWRVFWNPLMTSTHVYEREALVGAGLWNPTMTMGEDTDLNVRVIKNHPFEVMQLEEVLGGYRSHPLQTTKGGESHGAESGIEHPPDRPSFKASFAQLQVDYPVESERYWQRLSDIMEPIRRRDESPIQEFSLFRDGTLTEV